MAETKKKQINTSERPEKPSENPKPEPVTPDPETSTREIQRRTTGVTTVIPSDREKALEAIRPSEGGDQISLPRIVVLQSLSQEVTREDDPLKPGLLFNKLTKEVVGQDGKWLEFIPLMYFPQRLRMELGAGLRCRSIDMKTAQMMGGLTWDNKPTDNCGLCKLKLWPRDRIAKGETLPDDKVQRGPECSVVENFPALMTTGFEDPSDYELILLAFQRTSMQAAKDLRGNHAISGKDWWHNKYKLVVIRATGGPSKDAVFFKQEIRRNGVANSEQQTRAKQMVAFLAGRDIVAEELPEEDQVPVGTAANPEAAKETAF